MNSDQGPSRRDICKGKAKEETSCVACLDQLPPADLVALRCHPNPHYYCSVCITVLFQKSLANRAQPPPRCCRRDIEIDEVRHLLSADIVKAYEDKTIEYSTPNPTYCFRRECSHFIRPDRIRLGVGVCSACKVKTCTNCKQEEHNGPCLENQETKAVMRYATKRGWKRCYNCRNLVELSQGCNHMECICGAEFCYKCGSPWNNCSCRTPVEQHFRIRMREDIVRLNQEAAVRNPRRIPLPVYQRALRDLEEMNRNIELEEAHALRDQTEARPPTEAATRLQEINRRVNRLFNYSTRNPTLERRGEASGEPERLLNENRLPDQRSIPERSTNPFLRARQWLMRDVARTTGPHEQFPINRRSHEGNLPSTPRFPQLNPPQLIPTAPEFERPGQRGGQIYNELTPEYRRNFERQVTGGRRLELAMERERDRSRQLGEQGEASTRRTAPLGPTAPQGPPNSRRSTSSRVPTNPSNVSTVPAWVYTNPPGVNHEWNIHPNSTTAPERSRRVPTPGPAVEQNRDHNGCNHIWEELPEAVGLIMTCERVDCNARQFAQCLRCRERVCAWCNLRRHLLPTTAEQRAARRAECQIQVESDRELLRRREHDLERMRGSVRTLQMEQGEPEDDVE